jgi:hypothetical protein
MTIIGANHFKQRSEIIIGNYKWSKGLTSESILESNGFCVPHHMTWVYVCRKQNGEQIRTNKCSTRRIVTLNQWLVSVNKLVI